MAERMLYLVMISKYSTSFVAAIFCWLEHPEIMVTAPLENLG